MLYLWNRLMQPSQQNSYILVLFCPLWVIVAFNSHLLCLRWDLIESFIGPFLFLIKSLELLCSHSQQRYVHSLQQFGIFVFTQSATLCSHSLQQCLFSFYHIEKFEGCKHLLYGYLFEYWNSNKHVVLLFVKLNM